MLDHPISAQGSSACMLLKACFLVFKVEVTLCMSDLSYVKSGGYAPSANWDSP